MEMDGNFNEQLRDVFLEETTMQLEDFEQSLLSLEKTDDRAEELARIFRVAHSIKGSAATVGFNGLAAFAHTAEDCLSVVRNNPNKLSTDFISLMLETLDIIKGWVQNLKTNFNAPDHPRASELQDRLREFTARMEGPDSAATVDENASSQGWGMFDDVEAVDSKKEKVTGEVAEDIVLAPLPPAVVPPSEKAAPREGRRIGQGKGPSFLKIDSERVDAVMDLVGELVVIKSQLLQDKMIQEAGEGRLGGLLSLMDKTVRDLYDRALTMRMMSLKSQIVKLERAVRDVAVKLGKEVEFIAIGEDTELDRAIIEQLGDPLVHLCRNAVDHGIERPEERERLGKPRQGRLQINARSRGSNVIIEIKDDGGGVSRQAVIEKALRKGVISSRAQAEKLTDSEVFDILFAPGFSTADVVTDVSGRGVGLDVVRSNITALKGHVEVQSKVGQGTTFVLKLPLTTAITDGVIFRVGRERFILPLENVSEFVTLDKENITCVEDEQETIQLHGRFLPLLHLDQNKGAGSNHKPLVIVIEGGGKKAGLVVDEVIDQNQIVLKSLNTSMETASHVAGAAILGDGHVALVLDATELLAA